MKKIDESIYEHNGRVLSTVSGSGIILRCEKCFFEHTCCSKGLTATRLFPETGIS